MLPNKVERRNHKRHANNNLISLDHSSGICDIVDISYGGLSIKCLKLMLPDIWWASIIDRDGRILKDYPVEKVWSKVREDSVFYIEAGVKFMGLTQSQQAELDYLINDLSDSI